MKEIRKFNDEYENWIMLEIQLFYKFFYKLLIWWMIICKWKSVINDGLKWKPIRDWLHQHFVKIL